MKDLDLMDCSNDATISAMGAFSPKLIQAQLRAIIRDPSPDGGDLIPWLSVVEVALDRPRHFLQAVRSLSVEDRFSLVHIASSQSAPLLADHLLALLAASIGDEDDAQLTYDIAEAYRIALGRARDRLAALQQRLASREEFAQVRASLDISQLIAEQNVRLAEMREKEIEENERYAALHAVERDIWQLETKSAAVAQYDFAAREQYHGQLAAKVEAEVAQRAKVEEQIRNESAALAEATMQLQPVRILADDATRQRREVEAEIAQCIKNTQEWAVEEVSLRDEGRRLDDEMAKAVEQRKTLVRHVKSMKNEAALLHADTAGMAETEALSNQAADLEVNLQSLYALLLPDEADAIASSGRP